MAGYIYAVGSPFEEILNNYMITSEGIYPPGLDHGLDETVANSSLSGLRKALSAGDADD